MVPSVSCFCPLTMLLWQSEYFCSKNSPGNVHSAASGCDRCWLVGRQAKAALSRAQSVEEGQKCPHILLTSTVLQECWGVSMVALGSHSNWQSGLQRWDWWPWQMDSIHVVLGEWWTSWDLCLFSCEVSCRWWLLSRWERISSIGWDILPWAHQRKLCPPTVPCHAPSCSWCDPSMLVDRVQRAWTLTRFSVCPSTGVQALSAILLMSSWPCESIHSVNGQLRDWSSTGHPCHQHVG